MAFPSNNCWDSPQSFAEAQCCKPSFLFHLHSQGLPKGILAQKCIQFTNPMALYDGSNPMRVLYCVILQCVLGVHVVIRDLLQYTTAHRGMWTCCNVSAVHEAVGGNTAPPEVLGREAKAIHFKMMPLQNKIYIYKIKKKCYCCFQVQRDTANSMFSMTQNWKN